MYYEMSIIPNGFTNGKKSTQVKLVQNKSLKLKKYYVFIRVISVFYLIDCRKMTRKKTSLLLIDEIIRVVVDKVRDLNWQYIRIIDDVELARA